jgi:hypothetical protein
VASSRYGRGWDLMNSQLAQLADVQSRLDEAILQLRLQQRLVAALDCPHNRATLVMLLTNGLRVFCWLEDQYNGLLELIGEERPLPRN